MRGLRASLLSRFLIYCHTAKASSDMRGVSSGLSLYVKGGVASRARKARPRQRGGKAGIL
jgi:hypothetical protein